MNLKLLLPSFAVLVLLQSACNRATDATTTSTSPDAPKLDTATGMTNETQRFVGTWRGNLSNAGNSPTVVLTIHDDGGKLTGTCTRLTYLGSSENGEFATSEDAPLIEPEYTDSTLSFGIQEPGSARRTLHNFSSPSPNEGVLQTDISFAFSDEAQFYPIRELFPERELGDFVLSTNPHGGTIATLYGVAIKLKRS